MLIFVLKIGLIIYRTTRGRRQKNFQGEANKKN